MRPDTSDPEDAYEHCEAHRLDNHTAFLLGLQAFHPPHNPPLPRHPHDPFTTMHNLRCALHRCLSHVQVAIGSRTHATFKWPLVHESKCVLTLRRGHALKLHTCSQTLLLVGAVLDYSFGTCPQKVT